MLREMTYNEMMESNGGSWAAAFTSIVAGLMSGGNPYAMVVAYEIAESAKNDYEENWNQSDIDNWVEIHKNSYYPD